MVKIKYTKSIIKMDLHPFCIIDDSAIGTLSAVHCLFEVVHACCMHALSILLCLGSHAQARYTECVCVLS